MDKEGFIQMLKDSLILWDVDQMFHTRLSDAVLEDLSALGIESLDRELNTRKECNAILETFAGWQPHVAPQKKCLSN